MIGHPAKRLYVGQLLDSQGAAWGHRCNAVAPVPGAVHAVVMCQRPMVVPVTLSLLLWCDVLAAHTAHIDVLSTKRTALFFALRKVKRYSGSSVPSLGRSASDSSSQYCRRRPGSSMVDCI